MGRRPLTPESFTGLTLPRFRPWREVAILCVMIMELSWVVPWYRSLTPATYATSPLRAFLVLGGLFFLAHLVVRVMNFLHMRMDVRRGVMVGLFLVSILVGLKTLLYVYEPIPVSKLVEHPLKAFSDLTTLIPNEFFITIVVLVACWRGITLAQDIIGPQMVLRNFQIGVIMFLAYVFINTIVTGENLGLFPYLFLFTGLIAMGSARISVLSSLRGGGQNPFDRRWFLGMVFATVVVVGLASLVARLVSGRFMIVGQIGAVFLQLFVLLIFLLLSPLFYILPLIIERLRGDTSITGNLVQALEDLQRMIVGMAGQLTEFLERSGVLISLLRLKPIFLWSIVVIVGFFALLTLTRWLVRTHDLQDEERQSLLGRGDLWQILRESLRYKLQKLGKGLVGMAHLRQGQRLLAAARIRRIYTHLMGLSASLGAPRPVAQTPLEFLPTLKGLFPEHEDDLVTITRAYLRVRYGELPETRQEVKEVESAWERVHAQGREQLSEKKR